MKNKNCNKGNIFSISGNNRFKIIKLKNESLIIDVDQTIWMIVFPLYHWLFPINVYKIPAGDIQKIKTIDFEEKVKNPIITASIRFGVLISIVIKPLFTLFVIEQSVALNYIELLIAILISVMIKYQFYKDRNIDYIYKWRKKRVKLKPEFSTFYFTFTFKYIIALTILFFSVAGLLILSNAVYFPCIILFLSLYLFLNSISVMSKNVCVSFKDI